jgi:hypothetical protein
MPQSLAVSPSRDIFLQLENLPTPFLREWLRRKELKCPRAKDDIPDRLRAYIEQGLLSESEVRDLCLEYAAYGSKKVFLFNFSSVDSDTIGHLQKLIAAVNNSKVSHKNGSLQRIGRFFLSGFSVEDLGVNQKNSVIHLVLHKDQQVFKINREDEKEFEDKTYVLLEKISVSLFVYVDVNVSEGQIELRFDNITGIGPQHKNAQSLSEKICDFFGLAVPAPVLSTRVGDNIRLAQESDFADITQMYEHTDDDTGDTTRGMCRFQTTSVDINSLPGAQAAISPGSQDSYFKRFKATWVPDKSNGHLVRSVTIVVNVDTGEVVFMTPCFEEEMKYVLSRVRHHC